MVRNIFIGSARDFSVAFGCAIYASGLNLQIERIMIETDRPPSTSLCR